jgi:hypothetical protein
VARRFPESVAYRSVFRIGAEAEVATDDRAESSSAQSALCGIGRGVA